MVCERVRVGEDAAEPYADVVPYETVEVAGLSVFQIIVAVSLAEEAETEEMTGGTDNDSKNPEWATAWNRRIWPASFGCTPSPELYR